VSAGFVSENGADNRGLTETSPPSQAEVREALLQRITSELQPSIFSQTLGRSEELRGPSGIRHACVPGCNPRGAVSARHDLRQQPDIFHRAAAAHVAGGARRQLLLGISGFQIILDKAYVLRYGRATHILENKSHHIWIRTTFQLAGRC
jgi:hypothetical protein